MEYLGCRKLQDESRINMGCVCCKRTKFVVSCKMKGVELGAIVGELRKSAEVMDVNGEESSETDSSSSICSSFADDEEDDDADDDDDDDDGEIERITSLRIDPSQIEGEVKIDSIRLIHWTRPGEAKTVRFWDF